jgi:hypothetical protein
LAKPVEQLCGIAAGKVRGTNKLIAALGAEDWFALTEIFQPGSARELTLGKHVPQFGGQRQRRRTVCRSLPAGSWRANSRRPVDVDLLSGREFPLPPPSISSRYRILAD